MRTITATEKHRAVNEGQMSEGEFVRQMRLAFPQHINQFSGYKDSVQILMNRGVLSESVLEKDLDNTISDDSLRRALDIELTAMGHDPVTCSDGEAQQKAKTKALDANNFIFSELKLGNWNEGKLDGMFPTVVIPTDSPPKK